MNVLGFKRKVIVDNTSVAERVENKPKKTYNRQTRTGTADTVAFGKHLCDLRKRAKVPQAEIAAELGINANTYSTYETGRGLFPAIYVKPLCELCDITPSELFDYVIECTQGGQEEPKSTDARLDALEQIVMQLIDEQRKKY